MDIFFIIYHLSMNNKELCCKLEEQNHAKESSCICQDRLNLQHGNTQHVNISD